MTRLRVLAWFVGVLLCFGVAPIVAPIVALRAQEGRGISFEADRILFDAQQQTLEAEGDVFLRFPRPSNVLRARAERVYYDHSKQRLRSEGDGLLELEERTLLQFDSLTIDRVLGKIEAKGVGLRRLGKLGGARADRLQADWQQDELGTLRLFGAVYSPCPICADRKSKAKGSEGKKPLEPLWQIRSRKIVFDPLRNAKGEPQNDARVHFTNATFEILGVPVLYSPYLSFPRDDRGSGFLPLGFGFTSRLGAYATLPVYWAPLEGLDFTYAPTLSSLGKGTSDIEMRSVWQDFALDVGGSIAHRSEQGRVRTLGWARADWQGAHGLRAQGQGYALSDRRYFSDYEKGTKILSNEEPDVINDDFRLEHFGRNGYAQARVAQFRHVSRHIQDLPLPTEQFLPYLSYENEGRFGEGGRGAGHWRARGLWRGAEGLATLKPNFVLHRQDLVSTQVHSGGSLDLGGSFQLRSEATVQGDYYRERRSQKKERRSQKKSDSTEQIDSTLESWRALPAVRLQVDGLFATRKSSAGRYSYLRPIVEGYASLDDTRAAGIEGLDGDIERYGNWGDFGLRDQSPGIDAFESGQRLSGGLHFSTFDAEGSFLSLYSASGVKRSIDNRALVRLLVGAEGSWRGRLDALFHTERSLADFSERRTKAETRLNFRGPQRKFFPYGSVTLTYARSFAESSLEDERLQIQHDVSAKGTLHVTEQWRTEAWMRYNFLNPTTALDRYGLDILYKGACFNFKLGFETTHDYSTKRLDAFRYTFGLQADF